jgi:excinuclease ABC subunit C
VLQLVERVRDEAHRFAITFHRQSRARRDFRSVLDEVEGIGPRKKKLLLQRFGSVKGVREASLPELAAVVGPTLAGRLHQHLAESADESR